MVCFQATNGNANAQRRARGKHFILFDLPADKGVQLKAAQPLLGWVSDIDGHPALPFSIGNRLILQTMAERDHRDVSLFAEFPTEQLLARLWSNIVGHLNVKADNIFTEVIEAAAKAEDQEAFVSVAGDWMEVEGDADGDGLARWVSCITRGDAFEEQPGKTAGIAGSEIIYYRLLART